MAKAGLIEEMMNDALDSALDTEEMEQETEDEIEKVLMEVAGEVMAALPAAKAQPVRVDLNLVCLCCMTSAARRYTGCLDGSSGYLPCLMMSVWLFTGSIVLVARQLISDGCSVPNVLLLLLSCCCVSRLLLLGSLRRSMLKMKSCGRDYTL